MRDIICFFIFVYFCLSSLATDHRILRVIRRMLPMPWQVLGSSAFLLRHWKTKTGQTNKTSFPCACGLQCLAMIACLFYLNALFAEAISCVPSWRWSRTSTMIQRAQKDRCMKLLTLTHTLSLTSLPHLSRYSLMCSQMCAVSNFHRFLCFLRALAVEVLVD